MRNILAATLVTLGIGGGVAAAEPRVVVHEHEVRYRDYHHRPAVRYERHHQRAGYRWREGNWRWHHDEWVWEPGVYVRIR